MDTPKATGGGTAALARLRRTVRLPCRPRHRIIRTYSGCRSGPQPGFLNQKDVLFGFQSFICTRRSEYPADFRVPSGTTRISNDRGPLDLILDLRSGSMVRVRFASFHWNRVHAAMSRW